MEFRNIVMYHSSEYWYMGSMLERSVVQKKRSCVRVATGMYLLRVWSISTSVFSASITLAYKQNINDDLISHFLCMYAFAMII